VHRADVWTHTWVRRRELAREWSVEIVLRRAISKPRWCRLLRRNMLSSCSRDRYVCWRNQFVSGTMLSLGSHGSGQTDHGEKWHRSTCLATIDCTCRLQMQHNNIRFSKTAAVLGPAHSAVNWQEVEHSSGRSCELVSKI
jgi:hypothetical protein